MSGCSKWSQTSFAEDQGMIRQLRSQAVKTNTQTNTHEPNSCVLSYHTLKLFLLPAQTHWFSFPKDYILLVSYTAWHYPWVCTTYCFIFPQLWITVSWTQLQLGRGEMYWIAYFLFLLHPQSVCACLIHNLLNNWFFSFLAKQRKSKPFFSFFMFLRKKTEKNVLCWVKSYVLEHFHLFLPNSSI